MVYVVGHRPAVRDSDVRSNNAAAETIGNQVTVLHAGTSRTPLIIPDWFPVAGLLEAALNTMTRQIGSARRVCRKNHIDTETKFIGIKVESHIQITA
jgi:hypothetical protein